MRLRLICYEYLWNNIPYTLHRNKYLKNHTFLPTSSQKIMLVDNVVIVFSRNYNNYLQLCGKLFFDFQKLYNWEWIKSFIKSISKAFNGRIVIYNESLCKTRVFLLFIRLQNTTVYSQKLAAVKINTLKVNAVFESSKHLNSLAILYIDFSRQSKCRAICLKLNDRASRGNILFLMSISWLSTQRLLFQGCTRKPIFC